MPRYQAVFFDAGDTLLDFYSTGARATDLVAAHTGRRIPAAEAAPYFDAAFHHALGGRTDGLLWVNDSAAEQRYWAHYYEGWLAAAGLPADPALVAALVADTLQVEIYDAFADVVPTLEALAAAGVARILISNAFPSMQRIMRHLDLERHFDACLYSCFEGYEKPQAEIFDRALAAAGLPAAATCFVDDLPHNVEAASSLGIQGFLIDRWARHRHSPLPRLAGLADLLGRVGV